MPCFSKDVLTDRFALRGFPCPWHPIFCDPLSAPTQIVYILRQPKFNIVFNTRRSTRHWILNLNFSFFALSTCWTRESIRALGNVIAKPEMVRMKFSSLQFHLLHFAESANCSIAIDRLRAPVAFERTASWWQCSWRSTHFFLSIFFYRKNSLNLGRHRKWIKIPDHFAFWCFSNRPWFKI
jgi:hypothetical protein